MLYRLTIFTEDKSEITARVLSSSEIKKATYNYVQMHYKSVSKWLNLNCSMCTIICGILIKVL
jgi:hypothetical protein